MERALLPACLQHNEISGQKCPLHITLEPGSRAKVLLLHENNYLPSTHDLCISPYLAGI